MVVISLIFLCACDRQQIPLIKSRRVGNRFQTPFVRLRFSSAVQKATWWGSVADLRPFSCVFLPWSKRAASLKETRRPVLPVERKRSVSTSWQLDVDRQSASSTWMVISARDRGPLGLWGRGQMYSGRDNVPPFGEQSINQNDENYDRPEKAVRSWMDGWIYP